MRQWYIGDPCYAIKDDRWDEFCENLFAHPDYKTESGDTLGGGYGIEMMWTYTTPDTDEPNNPIELLTTLYIYDSPFGDGVWDVHGHLLGVDAGLLSVLPIEVCDSTDGGAVVESEFRPVFETSKQFPYVALTINKDTQFDTAGHSLCDICEEWAMDNDMLTNPVGDYCCGECFTEGEE